MKERGFKQLITFVTTEGGTLLDHLYVKGIDIEVSLVPVYYSYHEAVRICLC